MSCIGCFNGCSATVSDKCVKYTGEDVNSLSICQNDSLYQIEQILINKILELISASGITPDVDLNCSLLTTLLNGRDKTALVLFEIYADAICNIDTRLTDVENEVNTSTSFNTSCLTGLPTNPSRDDILQALLNKVCTMSTTLDNINNDYVKATQLNALIASYLSSTSGSTQQFTKMVPYVAYEYYGPMSNFDSGGVGLSSAGFQKVYVCNGSNGTPDKRGRVAVGAIQGTPGTAPLDPAVDPSLPANTGTNYSLNQKFGQSFVTLNTNQIPSHTHTVTDPGHKHSVSQGNSYSGCCGGVSGRGSADASSFDTVSNVTGITINAAGGGQAHENRQPSIAANFIMYIP